MIGVGFTLIAATVFATAPSPAFARATELILVNGTGSAMGTVSIRRFQNGTWRTLGVSQRPGGRLVVAFKEDGECLFDIRADVAEKKDVIWSGVNLCEVNAIILHRNDSGAVWVDYDEASGEELRVGS